MPWCSCGRCAPHKRQRKGTGKGWKDGGMDFEGSSPLVHTTPNTSGRAAAPGKVAR